MRNGFIAVVWLLLIGLGIFAWLSTQDYDLSKALRFARSEQPTEATPAPGEPAPAKEAAREVASKPPSGVVVPSFDIVRVEPDGTAVVAGRAGVGDTVTVLVDGESVGTVKADERGEWALVVDNQLGAGNHSLTVSSMAGDTPINSEQSVAIAVPEHKDEKPLIVLSQKGEPSKVIQTPESVTTVQTQPEPAEQTTAQAETGEAATPEAKTETAVQKTAEAKTDEATAPEAKAETPAAVQKTAEARTDDASAPDAETAAPASEQRTAKAEPADEGASEAAPGSQTVASPPKSDEAAAPAETAEPARPAASEKAPELALRTVDYDDKGNMVFQGTSEPGSTVRVYVDNKPIADATANEDGVWTLRVVEEVEPGDHDLRVDQIKEGAKVAARIELPFTRAKPEEVMAAMQATAPEADKAAEGSTAEPAAAPGSDAKSTNVVAASPSEPAPSGTSTGASESAGDMKSSSAAPAPMTSEAPAATAGASTATSADGSSATPPSSSTEAAPSTAASSVTPTTSSSATPTASSTMVKEAPATSEPMKTAAAPPTVAQPEGSSAPTAEKTTDEPPAPPAPPAATSEPAATSRPVAETTSQASTTSAETTTAAPKEAAPQPSAPAEPSTSGDAGQAPATAAASGTTAEAPTSAAGSSEAPAAETASRESETVPQQESAEPAKVAAASGSATTSSADGTTVVQRTGRVIIQPGNNLWNISRVIYGQGISYTTIYSANKDQIRDPDRIYPGQIFVTPGATPPEQIAPDRREPIPGVQDNG